MFKSEYYRALEDYKLARRKAAIQELLARITGNPEDVSLLSYDDVRHKLQAIEKSVEHLKEIPLDAIVGSVGRYHDFTRKFLPRKNIDQGRWARVMASSQDLSGLPPIDVYQIGDVYFVKDGNHRVSVARQMGNTVIQAYVTVVETKVPLLPDDQPDDLIIKGELVKFLDKTNLDRTIPESNLIATKAGAYPTLLEHIDVHRYYQGLDQEREISFPEAAESWYRSVYQPVLEIIKQRDLLRDFPERTAIDLYLWAADRRAALRDLVGWDIGPEAALSDLTNQFGPTRAFTLKNVLRKIVDFLLPVMFESGPPPGTWREKLSQMTVLESLFSNIIVALDDSSNSWNALEMAAQIANAERSSIHGIHIHADLQESPISTHDQLENEFYQHCQKLGVEKYDFFIAEGEVWKVLIDHSRFADLIVLPLNHPPGDKPIQRLSSGLITLIRGCPIPVLTIPVKPQVLKNIVLAYDGSLKAQEALFIAAYLGSQLGTNIKVITSTEGFDNAEKIRDEAMTYLGRFPIHTESLITDLDISTTISQLSGQEAIDLILIGGYGGSSILPIMLGTMVDKVLREIQLPILICR